MRKDVIIHLNNAAEHPQLEFRLWICALAMSRNQKETFSPIGESGSK
jgi:hypothetical protein